MCSRIFNNRNKNYPTTARNMDWKTQLPTSIFTFKKGLDRIGTGIDDKVKNPLTWTSLYDTTVAMVVSHGVHATSDGMNSEGLVANLLYDCNANYENKHQQPDETYYTLNVLRWAQYVLDTCRSVQEVVNIFDSQARKPSVKVDEKLIKCHKSIVLMGTKVPGSDAEATLHLSVSDAYSESAVIEVENGEFKVYHNYKNSKTAHRIMTNEPDFKTQILLNNYWLWQWASEENKFASKTIPGGPFPADRFQRASFYMNHLSSPDNMEESLAQVRSIAANVSVPIGFNINLKDSPNISPTIWSTVADQINIRYYFCNARTTDIVWVDLHELQNDYEAAKFDVVTLKKDDKGIEMPNEDKNFENFIKKNGSINNLFTKVEEDPFKLLTA